MAPVHAPAGLVRAASAPDRSRESSSLPPHDGTCAARQALCSTSPARAASARRPSSAALGLAAAAAGQRTIVCEVAEQDRVSRAFQREGVAARDRGRARREPVGDHDRPQPGAAGVARPSSSAAARRCACSPRSSAFQYFVAAAPGAREMITIAKVFELAQLERWDRAQPHLRPRDRRRARLRPRPRDAHRRRTRSARSPASARSGARPRRSATMLSDPRRTGYVAVALAEEMPVNETLELGGAARGRRRPRPRRHGRQRPLPRALHAAEAESLRAAAANGLEPGGAGGGPRRADASTSARAQQQAHLRRLARRRARRCSAAVPVRARGRAGGVPARWRSELGRDLERARPPAARATRVAQLAHAPRARGDRRVAELPCGRGGRQRALARGEPQAKRVSGGAPRQRQPLQAVSRDRRERAGDRRGQLPVGGVDALRGASARRRTRGTRPARRP